MAYRLRHYVDRDMTDLKWGDSGQTEHYSLRSGVVRDDAWLGAEKLDFGDNITILAAQYAADKAGRDKFLPYKKGVKVNRTVFLIPKRLRTELKAASIKIRDIMSQRALGHLPEDEFDG